jgi:hypothetical protein
MKPLNHPEGTLIRPDGHLLSEREKGREYATSENNFEIFLTTAECQRSSLWSSV